MGVSINELNEKIRLTKRTGEWKSLKRQGDVGALAEELKVSRTAISAAINKGEGSLSLLRSIDKFYSERKALLTS